VVIESDFADGPRRRGPRELVAHPVGGCRGLVLHLVGLMRVHADRDAHRRPQAHEAVRVGRLDRIPGLQNDQNPLESRGLRAGDHVRQIGRERLVRQMTVRIDHDDGRRPDAIGTGVRSIIP
jgi:hypothetical protein